MKPTNTKINPRDLGIYHIRDVKTLVKKVFKDGYSFEFRYESKKVMDCLEFEMGLFKHPRPLRISLRKFPNSKYIQLYHKLDGRRGHIIIKSTSHKDLYFLVQNLQKGRHGYRSNNKFDRYRSLYFAYEGLVKRKKYKFVAIRHSLSHPKIDNLRSLKVIKDIFGDDIIDIQNYKHRKKLQELHEELLKCTEEALTKLLLKLAKKSKERLGQFVII